MKLLNLKYAKGLLPPRKNNTHKGDYGHTLVIAGSMNYSGAAILCSHGALRAGSGLVTLAFPETLRIPIMKRLLPEVMTLPVPDKNYALAGLAALKLLDFIKNRRVTSVALGCGLSVTKGTSIFVNRFLKNNFSDIVIDADAINILKNNPELITHLKSGAVITPHPAELSRLTGQPVKDIQKNRRKAAKEFAARYKVVCVLKGYRTVISDGERVFVNTTGNPGMAKGGSGDVLAGMIAAFMGQTKNIFNSALLGVFLHGLAGDIAAKEKSTVSMLPSDLINKIPEAVKILFQ
ncbi:MAG: Bifunctional NAD(P)H-hydrate repair enzyme Nnr [Elusimicrobia bacterium ADurb.Bin231]|nr:MAG: Bifunctional NAD(P)H-hydrate repair enzyme Nnr [Elusimicrobia bacterium ADurb.Bin231]